MSIKRYENIILMGYFNAEPSHMKLKYFMEYNNLYNSIKNKTCFKPVEGKCIDLTKEVLKEKEI